VRRRSTREERIAARIAFLEELLRDPTVQFVPAGGALPAPADAAPDLDPDPTVVLRLVRPRAVAGMDPRIRARRIEVRRARGRRRLRRLVVAAGAAAAVLTAFAATRTPLFDVDRVAVVGAVRTASADVIAAAAVPDGQALLDVDLAAIERRVDDLPWVAAAEASRHWPGTVVVSVAERQPVAVAPTEAGEWAVLAGDGRLMEVVAEPPTGLIPIADIPPIDEAEPELAPSTLDALGVVRLLPATLAPRVVAAAPAAGGRVELRLQPAGVIRIKPGPQLTDQIVAAATVLEATAGHCVGSIDVQVPEHPVLTPLPECG
jgi:cell division protein FtsQ